jgi:hypothetical protein
MPLESELLDALSEWFRDEYGANRRMLIHEEPQGRGGRRPDMLIIFAEEEREKVDEVFMIPVEIENSSKGAIRDRHNGLMQLRKYLATPSTSQSRELWLATRQGTRYLLGARSGGWASSLSITKSRPSPVR